MRSKLVLLALSVSLSSAALADHVVMNNGDRLTGTIIKSDGKSLTMKSEFAGEVTIKWDAVTEFSSTEPLNLTLKNKQKLAGTVTASQGKVTVATAEAGQVTLDKTAVQTIRNQDEEAAYQAEVERYRNPGLLDLWAGHADFGFAAARGNAETSALNLGFTADRATKRNKLSVHLTSIRASNSTTGVELRTANATRGGAKYNVNFSSRFSTFGFTDLEFDEFQSLDLRFVGGGGLEYAAVKREHMTLDIQGGGSFNKEFFSNDRTRTSGELLAGQNFTYKLFHLTDFEEKLIFYPNMTERGDYRVNLDIGTVTRLNSWLSFQLSVSERYLSNPIPGHKRNDILFTTGVRVSFKR